MKDAKNALTEFAGVDIKELKKAATELTKLKKAQDESEGNYKKLYETQQEQTAKETKAAADALKVANDLLASERTNNALTKALVEHHVDPILVDSAATLLAANVAVDDKGVPMVGDKPVADFVKEWTVGDVGKRFVTDANFGGDASGPGGKGDANAAFYDPNSPSFSRTEQGKIANTDPTAHAALSKNAPAKKEA